MKSIKEIDFSELSSKKNFAFADVTTISLLSKNEDILTVNISNNVIYDEIKRRTNRDKGWKNTLEILSRLVVYESLVIDKIGLKSLIVPDAIRDLLEKTTIPTDVYANAASDVHKMIETEHYMNAEESLPEGATTSDYEFYVDNIFNLAPLDVSTIADTGPTIPRALLYLILSERCQAPIFLSPSKDQLLAYILNSGLSYEQIKDLSKQVENQADKDLLGSINYLSTSQITNPPITSYLIETARTKKQSILDAFLELKSSKDARAFREWRHSVHQNIILGTRPAVIEAHKQWVEMEKAVKTWSENLDIGIDTTHKYSMFGFGVALSVLEKIGIKLELPMAKFQIKDPIINPRKHLRFIASWYKN